MLDRGDEPIDGTLAQFEICGCEKDHLAIVGLGDYDWRLIVGRVADRFGLVVAMVCIERHLEPRLARLPLGSLPNCSVGDVAQ